MAAVVFTQQLSYDALTWFGQKCKPCCLRSVALAPTSISVQIYTTVSLSHPCGMRFNFGLGKYGSHALSLPLPPQWGQAGGLAGQLGFWAKEEKSQREINFQCLFMHKMHSVYPNLCSLLTDFLHSSGYQNELSLLHSSLSNSKC